MKRLLAALLPALALTATLVAQAPAAKPLDIYVVDTEGGKADAVRVADRPVAVDRQRQSGRARHRPADGGGHRGAG